MIKLYFKQAFHLLGENKLLSSISIIGTALAIAMIGNCDYFTCDYCSLSTGNPS